MTRPLQLYTIVLSGEQTPPFPKAQLEAPGYDTVISVQYRNIDEGLTWSILLWHLSLLASPKNVMTIFNSLEAPDQPSV